MELNHTYVVKHRSSLNLLSITVLKITEKLLFIQMNKGLETNEIWEYIDEFKIKYTIIEDVTSYLNEDIKKNF